MSEFFAGSSAFAEGLSVAILPFAQIFEVFRGIVSPFVSIADGASQLIGMFV
ncbi:hypothetical protein [Corynebacterium sp. HMSC036D02]|uniref:hypothetical protein n=1 Tax=Corynebacterium sp. HMSC036D02 TaxID=1715013 RepID=UPI00143CA0A2|nr:hypothetical protein [Corynebacterium sp. HMSC036D02]